MFTYTLVIASMLWICSALTCHRRGDSPSPYKPSVNDCFSLSGDISRKPDADLIQLFSTRDLRPTKFEHVDLPYKTHYDTCYLEIYPSGRPYFDLASWNQISQAINVTIEGCLTGSSPPFVHGMGGRNIAGDNNWLNVEVSGRYAGFLVARHEQY